MQGSVRAGSSDVSPGGDVALDRLRVALDATPLIGQQTGVGAFCRGAIDGLSLRPSLDLSAFAVSWRRRTLIDGEVPTSVSVTQRPMPARPLHALWRRSHVPPIEWFIGDVDVVHGTNFVVPPTHRAGAVVSVHDLTPVHYPELCNAATLAYPGLIRRAIGRGAWVHTDSSFVADEVAAAFDVDRDRITTVHPGVPGLPEVSPDEAQHIVEHLLPADAPFVLSVGTAEPRKDLPGLVRAFDALASADHRVLLVLAGPSGWGEESLTAAIEGSQHASRIVRTGWVTPTELAALMGHSSLLAYPSLYEGFGFPPLQAMVAGIPVVATKAGSLPEVLGDGALMVDVGDHDALGQALIQLTGDDAARQRFIEAGRDQAAKYDWAVCAEGLEALYRRVHGERHG